jgi:glucose-6-phosphate dehydrogenase assembly protein OpcA
MATPAPAWSSGIDVAAIERELQRLTRLPQNTSSTGVPGTRTAVLNLVAYAADAATMERIVATLAALVDHHPSRTIVAMADADATAELSAHVRVDCRPMGTTGQKVCSEHVVLAAGPRALRRVPNVVLPLLLSDLPVVFWWPGEPALREPLLYDMLRPANRFVVDTLGFVHVERSLVTLDALRSRPGVGIDLADLNWGRMLPWRELIAQFWDVPTWRSHLARLARVEIQLGKPADSRSNRAQALLLAGWLASRLGWTPTGMERLRDGYRLRARRRGGQVELRIAISAQETSGLRRIELAREGARQTATFAVAAAEGDSAQMSVRLGGEEVYTRTARIERLDEAELLATELDMSSSDTVFEEALGAAAGFLRSA